MRPPRAADPARGRRVRDAKPPFAIIAGLVASFSVFTLFATWLLDKLGLPQDLLRNLAIALLFVLAAILLVPQRGAARSSGRSPSSRASGRGGASAAASCSARRSASSSCRAPGPVLATITVVAANNNVGCGAILLTLAYALGAAVPMLAIALGGREALRTLRAHAQTVRARLRRGRSRSSRSGSSSTSTTTSRR